MQEKYESYIPYEDIARFNSGDNHRAWLCFGCRYIHALRSWRFILWAPNAISVSLLGSFNGWDKKAQPMERLPGGAWICFVKGISEGALYKYCVTGADSVEYMKADPFARSCESGGEGASRVWRQRRFPWSDREYMKARAGADQLSRPMSVYELHAFSWRFFKGDRPLYRALGEALAQYCVDMGYTHVELLPLMEHPFGGSWGYQVTGYFAPSSRGGSPEDFKYMVDTLHSAGIGVIMDWVPAHFPRDGYALAWFDGTPLFECKEARMAAHPHWGTLIFDYASAPVRSFLISSACLFIEEYHIDGIRCDAVSSMLYLNYGREEWEYTPNKFGGYINLDAVDFLRALNSTVKKNYPGVLTVAEESTAYPKVSAPTQEGGLGFDLKWDMGYMHDTLAYMAEDPIFRRHHHEKLSFPMVYAFSERFVNAYSHDEVVYGKGSMINKMHGDYDSKFASLRLLYAYQYGHPGKKLNFMGNELGQFEEWNWNRPIDFFLLEYPRHRQLQDFCRELNRFYLSQPAMYGVDDSWEGYRWLNVDDRDKSAVAFMRMSVEDDSYIVCAYNFTPVRHDRFIIGLPVPGTLKELLSSDEERFGGGGVRNDKIIRSRKMSFLDMPHSAELTLPPLSAVMLRFRPRKEYRRNKP